MDIMKMGQSLFWGLVFLIIGIALIIRVIFKLDIPVFRLFIALVLIFLGIRLFLGGHFFPGGKMEENTVLFGEKTYRITMLNYREFNTVFGSSVYDLSELDSAQLPGDLKINTVFGGARVILPETVPFEVKGTAVFGAARMPGGNTAVFGSNEYRSAGFEGGKPALFIEVNAVFGEITITH